MMDKFTAEFHETLFAIVLVLFLPARYGWSMRSGAAPSRRSNRPPSPPQAAPAGDTLGLPTEFTGTGVDRERRRGRGAQSNATGRYEPQAREGFDDGWQSFEDLPPFASSVAIDTARKRITRNDSPDISSHRATNP